MKGKVKLFTVILTIGLLLATPKLNEAVNQTRKEPGFGGECIAWMMPGLIYTLSKTMKEGLIDKD
ncbi:hypothetical protein [Thomasclavelia spiroformis]|uniref:hypothetical protein n=1 Tax=Thomasclavelia spiroformis TaxID=29348 RepID=UPI003208FCEE